MKKLLLFLAILLGSYTITSAQDFNSAIGLRFGSPLSVSYKFFLSDNSAVEAIGSFRSNSLYSWLSAGAAYQIYNDIESVSGLQWFYGVGASAIFFNYDNAFVGDQTNISLGLQGYLGLSYTFNDIPLNLSIDWVPSFFLAGPINGFGGGYGALAARYVLSGN